MLLHRGAMRRRNRGCPPDIEFGRNAQFRNGSWTSHMPQGQRMAQRVGRNLKRLENSLALTPRGRFRNSHPSLASLDAEP